MHETAIPMGKMLHTFLAIHGRCKFIIFLRGQTLSLSAPTLILSLMEHFEGKAKNTVKYSVKSTFCRSIQINCNWLPGNPQPSPYTYIFIYIYIHILLMYTQTFSVPHASKLWWGFDLEFLRSWPQPCLLLPLISLQLLWHWCRCGQTCFWVLCSGMAECWQLWPYSVDTSCRIL